MSVEYTEEDVEEYDRVDHMVINRNGGEGD